MGAALSVVQKYYETFDSHSGGWKELVADDVQFLGPLQRASGKSEFVALTEQFLQFHRETRVVQQIEAGDTVSSVYEFVVDTPAGKPLTCSVSEWARVSNGRITQFKIFYDPREFAEAFGMQSG